MPTNSLTDAICRKAGTGKHFDGHGLHLHVVGDRKTWRMAYRLDGKPQTATFGPYPLLTLAEARRKRDDLRRQLLDGVDPRPKPVKRTPTLREATTTYWEGRQDVTPAYRNNALRAFEMHIAASVGDMACGVITKEDLLVPLNRMNAAGLFTYVRTTRMWMAQVFDWAIEHGYRLDNPARAIVPEKAFGKAAEVGHAAVELNEVPELLQRLSMEGDLVSALANQIMALTWVRTVEMRKMRWDEIEGDLWRIPLGTMKKRRDHLVPLSRQALVVLAKMKDRRRGDFVFASEHDINRSISENAVLYLLKRIGYGGRMTGHGWRSIASTWANERGYNPDAIERQLAHVPADKTRAAYNRAAYLPERRKMLQEWADWLDANSGGMKR